MSYPPHILPCLLAFHLARAVCRLHFLTSLIEFLASIESEMSQRAANPSHESPPVIKHFGATKPSLNPSSVVALSCKLPLQDHPPNPPPNRGAHPECRKPPAQQRFLHCLEEIKEAETNRAALPPRLSVPSWSPTTVDHHGPAMNGPSPGDGNCRASSSSQSPAQCSPPFHGCASSMQCSSSATRYDSLAEYYCYAAGNVDAGVTSPLHNGYAEGASHFRRHATSPASASPGNSQSQAPESAYLAPPPPASLSPSLSLPTYASYTASHASSSLCGPVAALPASLASRSPSASSATSSFPSSSSSHPSVSYGEDGEDLGPSACPFQASLLSAYAPFSASGVNGTVNSRVNGGVNMSPPASFPARPAKAPLERTSSGTSALRGGHGAGGSGASFSGVAEAGAGICSRELLSTIVTAHDIFARDMAWYAENAASGLVFGNMNTLMGQVVTTADVIVSNDVASDPRSAGVPPGHPPMTTFLGVPLFSGSHLVGMFAVTNREGGYSKSLVTELHALTKTVGQVVAGIQQRRQRWEREERLNAVLEGTYQAVLSVAPSGRLSCINRAARSLFGVPDQAMGPHPSGTGATSSSLSQPPAALCESELPLSDLIESVDGDVDFMRQEVLQRFADSRDSLPAVGLYHRHWCSHDHRSSQGGPDRDMSAAAVRINLRVSVTRGETPQVAYVLTVQLAGGAASAERGFPYRHTSCGRAEGTWRGVAVDRVGSGDGEGEEEDGHECQLLDEDGTLTIVV
ncbi:unnamed protein product [Closterium sp. Yama58-4]|nr:unnamed protein product [Closterium sp. Yama58-4]